MYEARMTLRFYLAYPEAERSSIVCFMRDGKERLRMGTGLKITTKNWDEEKERIKRNNEDSHHNNTLDALKGKLTDLFFVAQKTQVPDKLKYVYETAQKEMVLVNRTARSAETEPTESMILPHYEAFIERCSHKVKHSTLKSIRVVFNHYKSFSSHYKKNGLLRFEDITEAFYDAYVRYLFDSVGLTSSTVATNLKKFKQFLDYCSDRGLLHPSQYKHYFKWSKYNKESTLFALTDEDLRKLESVDLNDSPRLARVRDLFLIGCYTGLRFSDVSRLTKERFQDGKIFMHTMKDGSNLYLPIMPRLQIVLNRYPDYVFPTISLDKMNKYLKEVGQRAELTGKHIVTRYNRKGEAVETTVEKYEALSTHAGRRTLITQSLLRGVPRDVVKAVSGHRDDDSFGRYVRFASKDVGESMLKGWKD